MEEEGEERAKEGDKKRREKEVGGEVHILPTLTNVVTLAELVILKLAFTLSLLPPRLLLIVLLLVLLLLLLLILLLLTPFFPLSLTYAMSTRRVGSI